MNLRCLQQPAVNHRIRRCCCPGHTPTPKPAPRVRAAAATAPQPQQQQAASSSHSTDVADAAISLLVQQHGLDKDSTLVAQEARLAYTYLAASGSLPSSCSGVGDLMLHALELSDLLATGSTFRTLQMMKRHPGLLSLSPEQVCCSGNRGSRMGSTSWHTQAVAQGLAWAQCCCMRAAVVLSCGPHMIC
jgi:hypothetical protein